MAKKFKGRLEDHKLAKLSKNTFLVSIYDKDKDVTVVFEGSELKYLEWDGYPECNWTEAEFFMVEIEGDEDIYFVDTVDLNVTTRQAFLDQCESIYNVL